MPTIPTVDGLKVAPTPLAVPRVSPAAFGAPREVDLSGVAKVASDLATESRRNADQIAVSDADAQLVRAKTARLWDPKSGAMNARGKDAIGASDASTAAFQQDAADIEAGLSNDTQKQAFRRRADMHYADLGGQLGQHVANQIKQYDVQTTDGHVDAYADAALKGYQDDTTVQQAVDSSRAVLADFWKRNGHSDGKGGLDDFAKQHIADRVSAIRAAVLQQYATNGQDKLASHYFEQHKAEFTGKDFVKAQKLVDIGNSQGEGLRQADKILGLGQPDPLPGDPPRVKAATLSDALAQADKIADPDVRKEAVQSLVSHFTHLEQAARLDREAAATRVTQRLEDSRGRLNKADPDYQLLVGHPEEEHVLHHQDQILRPPKDPGDPEGFLAKVNLATVNPESAKLFMQETPKDWDGMNTMQKTHLVDLQKQLRAKNDRLALAEISKAETQVTHYQYAIDAAEKRGDPLALQQARREHQAAQTHAAELKAARARGVGSQPPAPAPRASVGDVDFSEHPTAHESALPVVHLTQQQLERIARDRLLGDTRYEDYLKSVGGVVPKVLPAIGPKATP